MADSLFTREILKQGYRLVHQTLCDRINGGDLTGRGGDFRDLERRLREAAKTGVWKERA